MSIESVISRIAKMRAATAPNNEKLKMALIRIGSTLESQMKLNIKRRRLIDTGRLINSIHYKAVQQGNNARLEVGSYGVPYAAFWEFGFHGIQQVRASNRVSKNGKPYGVRAHTRTVSQDARPYVKPALQKHRQFIINMIRSVGTE